MNQIKVVSFDADGTLVMPRFSQVIWNEAIPALYAKVKGMSFEQAKRQVEAEYREVGEQRMEWYDIKHWFGRFGLNDYQRMLNSYKNEISYYPEVKDVLATLSRNYKLIVTSNSSREFLDIMLEGIKGHFVRVFSSPSDFGEMKTVSFYLKVCREMRIEPGEMAHVGDNWEFDFLTAEESGIKAFYLDRKGSRGGSEVIGNLGELLSLTGLL